MTTRQTDRQTGHAITVAIGRIFLLLLRIYSVARCGLTTVFLCQPFSALSQVTGLSILGFKVVSYFKISPLHVDRRNVLST